MVIGALSTAPVAACPCPETPDPSGILEHSTVVFVGRVLDIREDDEDGRPTSRDARIVDFRIDQAWQGVERIRI
tara:strand:+ start:190 stop:411 length:222 start_codon:yes stop_codon:yes gene_type:complete